MFTALLGTKYRKDSGKRRDHRVNGLMAVKPDDRRL
jgi:hypothetical protein